jgi:hypothetical protein
MSLAVSPHPTSPPPVELSARRQMPGRGAPDLEDSRADGLALLRRERLEEAGDGVVVTRPVTRAPVERRGEHLGGQVGGALGIGGAADEERQHRSLVAVVEGGEGPRMPSRRGEHVIVAVGLPVAHHVT